MYNSQLRSAFCWKPYLFGALLLVASACGSKNTGPLTTLEGLYHVTQHSRNTSACAEGPQVQGEYEYFKIEYFTRPNEEALVMLTCTEKDSCSDFLTGWNADRTVVQDLHGESMAGMCDCFITCTKDVNFDGSSLHPTPQGTVELVYYKKTVHIEDAGTDLHSCSALPIKSDDPRATCSLYEFIMGEPVN